MQGLELAWRAFVLQPEAYVALDQGAAGLRLALAIVFLAGLSSALGQSLVLFANRVSQRRFAFSLVASAVLFVASYVLWATSIWAVALVAFGHARPYLAALRTVGLAYVPQLLAFLTITPYFGTFVSATLSVWTLLGIVIASGVAFDLSVLQAAATAGGGWVMLQLLQRTIGRPVRTVTRRLLGAVAGQRLMPIGDAIQRNATQAGLIEGQLDAPQQRPPDPPGSRAAAAERDDDRASGLSPASEREPDDGEEA